MVRVRSLVFFCPSPMALAGRVERRNESLERSPSVSQARVKVVKACAT